MAHAREAQGSDPATDLFARYLVRVGSIEALEDEEALRERTARALAAFGLDPAAYDALPINLYGQGYKLDEALTHSL